MILLSLAAAAAFQDTAALDRSVAAFTGRAIGEEGGARAAVDARLRLASCPTVALSWRTPAQDAVVVACTGPAWRVYVPVRAVAAPPTTLRAVAVPKAEPVIRRGDPVLVEAGADGFAITREGVAMGDAAPGARVAIRVEGSAQPVQATALEPGRATLPGWR